MTRDWKIEIHRCAIVAVVILANLIRVPARAQESPAGADPQEGKRLAIMICTACHIVSPDQPDPPILQPPAPNFRKIANKPGTTEQSLLTFLQTTHRTLKTQSSMPNPQLMDYQATAIVGYMMSLQKRH